MRMMARIYGAMQARGVQRLVQWTLALGRGPNLDALLEGDPSERREGPEEPYGR
jgi:hypothetical protein